MTFVSYAQNFEDVMLVRALRGVERGFYIDVGAQDPVNDSVTKAFYLRGWRGINVEPVTYWYERLLSDRPDDINVKLAVSDAPGVLCLFEVVDTGLSTTDAAFAGRHAAAGHQIRESSVPCVTLDALCDQYQVDCVHFLKIDCEGAEAAAIRGLSLEKVRPWVILVEATEPNSQTLAFEDWEPMLIQGGYHFVYQDGLNRYYVANERRELDKAFTYPPNVFDNYVRASEANAREALGTLQGEAVALRHNVDHLQTENLRREEALVEHRSALAQALAREAQHGAELGRMHEEIRLLGADIKRLREEAGLRDAEVERLHGEIHLRDAEVVRLSERIIAMHRSTSWRITGPLRGAKRAIRRLGRAAGWAAYWVLRWPARGARPLLRWLARWSWARAVAARIVRRDSTLGYHARLFLFGAPPPVRTECEDVPGEVAALTHHAANILKEIQKAKAMQRAGKGSAGSL